MLKFCRSALLAICGFLLCTTAQAADEKSNGKAAEAIEYSIGDKNAPVVMREFASLTCGHCADFHLKIMPEIKKNYIDTGKLRLVFQDYPLNAPALKAAAIARCVPIEQHQAMLAALFSTQQNWAAQPNVERALTQLARLAGLSEAKATACLKDEKLMEQIVAQQMDAQKKYGIEATPSFVFDGMDGVVRGSRPYPEFAEIIDGLLKKQAAQR